MNETNQESISADLYSDGTKIATVKVPATDDFPEPVILSFNSKIFALREEVSVSDDGPVPIIYDEVTPFAVSDTATLVDDIASHDQPG